MTRQTATNFTATGLQFPYGTVDTDFFVAEDVQVLAQAVDAHDHSSGLALPVARLAANASAAGNLLFASDNAADIGGAAANRPRNLYLAGNINIGGSAIFGGDAILTRDAANTLAQRNGTNSQTLRIYNTYTDASNYERLNIDFSAIWQIQPQAGGTGNNNRGIRFVTPTGSSGEIQFMTAGSLRWAIDAGGTFYPTTDNAYIIGSSGLRPSSIYLRSDLFIGRNLVHENAAGAIGFFGTAATAKKTVTGAKGSNAALGSLLTQLAAYGLITDSTSA